MSAERRSSVDRRLISLLRLHLRTRQYQSVKGPLGVNGTSHTALEINGHASGTKAPKTRWNRQEC
jgi:hypothetical protein